MPEISRIDVGGVNVTAWSDRDQFVPGDMELGQPVSTSKIVLVDDDGTLPVEPRIGLEVAVYDETMTVIFGGWIGDCVANPLTGARVWTLGCHDWAVRLSEAATGSLDQSGVLALDREFVIAIFRDALKAQTFQSATDLDDPIITANEPGWPGVQGTAIVSGTDWSYMTADSAMDSLTDRVANVYWRIRPDKIVEYGTPNERSAIVFSSLPSSLARPATLIEYTEGSYAEEELVASHRNKLRRGGAGAAEATAFDAVSLQKFGRIINGPYRNDESVPAGDIERLAYAELESLAWRRRITLSVTDAPIIKPGQSAGVVMDKLGPYEPDGGYPDMMAVDAPSPAGEPVDNYRGEFVVQRVTRQMLGPLKMRYEVVLGDHIPEFNDAIAQALTGG